MYCPQCFEERGPGTRFCVACGSPLEQRDREQVARDLAQNLFLIDEVEKWEKRGDLPPKFAKRLAAPYRLRVQRLEASLGAAIAPEPPAPGPVHASPPPPPAEGLLPPVAAVRAPTPAPIPVVLPEPQPVNELVAAPAPQPAPELLLVSDAVALASSTAEGPIALAELGAPPPSEVERFVERESSWSKVWKPFLYDNAIWFVGAFCIVSGSLYVASQAYSRVGDVARSLIVMGMMLVYAAGFGAAGWALGERKKLTSAGRILGLIGSAVAPVALFTLEPLRAHAPGLFGFASLVALGASAFLLKLACDRFDRRLSLRVAATGAVLMAWELAIPWASGEPGLAALVPLLALFSATGLLRPRDPEVERPSQAFGALSLLYLAGFDLARLHFIGDARPGLELYGPVAAMLGWIALRADRARLADASEQPRVPATTLGALALLGVGALASLVAEASAAAAAMISTLAFVDAARTYRRAPFVALASVLGLFAYYLSPDLIPHGVQLVIAAARRALGYPAGAPLPIAFAGISTVPYLVILAVVARRAQAQRQAWIYRPVGWAGVVLTLLLSGVAHSSNELRPGLWSSLALVALVGAALWLAEHAAAGYLFGWILGLLAFDVGRWLHPDAMPAFIAAGALVLLALARVTPERQRAPLAGEALLLTLAGTALALDSSDGVAALAFAIGAVALAALALETRSRLPAFLASASAVAATFFALSRLPGTEQLAPWLLAPAFALLLLSGLAAREASDADPRTEPFGITLPWPAEGLDLFRDPLAVLAAGLVLIALIPGANHLARGELPTGSERATFAVAALFMLAAARRQGWGRLGFLASILATAAALGSAPALALLGLAGALVAVAFTTWPAAARAALRCEGGEAADWAAVTAVLLPLLVAASHPAWLVVSAPAYLLLLRWKPLPALWLSLATAALWWAFEPLRARPPAMTEAALAVGLASLGLLAHVRPRWMRPALGVDAGVGDAALALMIIASLVGVLEVADRGVYGPALAPVAALLALSWLLAARQTAHAVPLFIGGGLALLAAVLRFPNESGQILLVAAIGLGLLANVVRVLGSAAEALFGPRPAKTIGYAFALLALGALLGLPLDHLLVHGFREPTWLSAWPYVAAATIFLAARALGWAPLHPVALAVLIADWALQERAPRLALLLGGASTALALAVATRRFPDALCLLFLDRPSTRARVTALRWSLLAGMMVAGAGAAGLTLLESQHHLAAVLAALALLTALSALAAPSPRWWLFAGALAIGAGLAGSDDARLLPAFAVANGLLLLTGALRLNAVDQFWRSALAATDADGEPPDSARPYGRALSLLVSWALLAVGLALCGEVFERLDARHALAADASTVVLLAPLTGLHLLWHRRGPWAVLLAFALPLLPVLYVSEPELVCVDLALAGMAYALLAWRLPSRPGARLLARIGLALPLKRRKDAAGLAFTFVVAIAFFAMAFTRLELGAWQTPATAGLLTVALTVASLRQRTGRFIALALLPATAHLGLAWLGVKLSTGRPHEAILGAWALASALLAVAAERFADERDDRRDVLVAGHFYFALGALELAGAIALMPGMHANELLFAGLAAALLGAFATLRALRTGNEVYAYLAQAALLAVYLLVRIQSDLIGARTDRDALSSVLLGFAFLGLHALARRAEAEVFDRPTRVMTHVLPLVGLIFLPQLSAEQGALYGLGLALHYAAVSATLGGSKTAAVLSGIALNASLAVTWMSRGIGDPQFYAIPFGATLLTFARLFRDDLSEESRFWLRTVGILAVYLASVASTVIYDKPSYVLVCALVCIGGVLLGVMLRVRVYVYLGAAVLVLDVLGNMARYGLHQPVLLGVMLTLLGFVLVGGWIYFISKREELLRRYAAVQALMREWE